MNSKEALNQAHDSVKRVADGAHHAVDAVADATNNAADTIHAKGKKLYATEEVWAAEVREYIREKPITTVLLAAAGGYIFSRVFGRR